MSEELSKTVEYYYNERWHEFWAEHEDGWALGTKTKCSLDLEGPLHQGRDIFKGKKAEEAEARFKAGFRAGIAVAKQLLSSQLQSSLESWDKLDLQGH